MSSDLMVLRYSYLLLTISYVYNDNYWYWSCESSWKQKIFNQSIKIFI